jgi:pimeloyl-ACP methyl ester carboxylesterase
MLHPTVPWPPPDIPMRIVETARGPVEFVELGQGLPVPVLYFHGTGATGEVVEATERSLAEDGFRLIAPHRGGYHGTPLASGRTPQDCADLAAALLDRLDIARVAVIGTSGGGPAAASFAARHATRAAALVLQCAVSHPYSHRRWMSRRMQLMPGWLRNNRWGLPVLRLGVRRELRRYLRDANHIARVMSGERYAEISNDSVTSQLAAVFVQTLVRCARERLGMENDWSNMIGQPWLEPGSVRVPTLILHDRADPLVPFAHAEWARDAIPTAELCDLRLGGHMIWLGADAPRLREHRAAFLRKHSDYPLAQYQERPSA